MGVFVSTDFLFGLAVGALLVILSQPLTRAAGRFARYLPLLLLIGGLLFALFVFLRG